MRCHLCPRTLKTLFLGPQIYMNFQIIWKYIDCNLQRVQYHAYLCGSSELFGWWVGVGCLKRGHHFSVTKCQRSSPELIVLECQYKLRLKLGINLLECVKKVAVPAVSSFQEVSKNEPKLDWWSWMCSHAHAPNHLNLIPLQLEIECLFSS